jgi:hypothetical protein
MERISSLSPEEIRKRIEESNLASYKSRAQYVCWENRALRSDYEFIDCPCGPECWCKHRGCLGHYRIKEISFKQFVETYVNLWTPKNARENIKSAVLTGKPFRGRQRNAIPALRWLHQNWSASLAKARGCNKCGLCDPNISIDGSVTNLYEAKMWSQLFYDVLVPFDTAKEGNQAGWLYDYTFLNNEQRTFSRLTQIRGDAWVGRCRYTKTGFSIRYCAFSIFAGRWPGTFTST